jgi:hypothetical protein
MLFKLRGLEGVMTLAAATVLPPLPPSAAEENSNAFHSPGRLAIVAQALAAQGGLIAGGFQLDKMNMFDKYSRALPRKHISRACDRVKP